MPAPTITPLPPAPLRSQNPATFASQAETFVDALEGLPTEINAFGEWLNTYTPGEGYAPGGTDVAIADGGTGASSAAGARTNLGLGAAAVLGTASASDVKTGTSTTSAITPGALADSAAPQTLTDGATIDWNMASGYNAKVTLGGNRTLNTPTNPKVGQTYSLAVIQDGTGSRTMTWPAAFDWGTTGAPTLTTTASKVDQITLYCSDAATPKFRAYLSGKGFSA